MRRHTAFVAALACGGCARLIGAQFDDAKLAEEAGVPVDAATADEIADLPDVNEPDAHVKDGAFDVFAPGDLQLWLAADRGVTEAFADAGDAAPAADAGPNNGVVAWEDLSGHGHGGAQAAGPDRPVLVANALAGTPVVSFERARKTCLTTTWTAAPGGVAATIFAVTQGSPDSLLRFQGSLPSLLIFPYNASLGAPPPDLRLLVTGDQGVFMRVAHDLSAYDVITARIAPNVLGGTQTWRNGKLVEQASYFADAMPAADVFTIGCHISGVQFANGNVAEVLYYNATLGDAARVRVENYLRDKWSIVF
jgi:hypothetical protein